MGSRRFVTAGLVALALAGSGLVMPAFGQGASGRDRGTRDRVPDSKAGSGEEGRFEFPGASRGRAAAPSMTLRVDETLAQEAAASPAVSAPPVSAPPVPAPVASPPPATPPGRTIAPGPPLTPPTPPAAVPPSPPGLSGSAPDTPPAIGIVGGKRGSSASPAATPEPSTLFLMATGLAGIYGLRRRR